MTEDAMKALERVIEKAKSHAGSFCGMDEYKQNEADCLTLRTTLQQPAWMPIGVVVGHENYDEREAIPYSDMGYSLKKAITEHIYGSEEEAYRAKAGEEIDEIFQALKTDGHYDFEAGCIYTVPLRQPPTKAEG